MVEQAAVPLGGIVRASIGVDVTGEDVNKIYHLTIFYGHIAADNSFSLLQRTDGTFLTGHTTITGGIGSYFKEFDVNIPMIPGWVGYIDALITVSESVDAQGIPQPPYYHQITADDQVRLFSPYGATITGVMFSSV